MRGRGKNQKEIRYSRRNKEGVEKNKAKEIRYWRRRRRKNGRRGGGVEKIKMATFFFLKIK